MVNDYRDKQLQPGEEIIRETPLLQPTEEIITYYKKGTGIVTVELIDDFWHIVRPLGGKSKFLSRARAENALLHSGYQLVRADETEVEEQIHIRPNGCPIRYMEEIITYTGDKRLIYDYCASDGEIFHWESKPMKSKSETVKTLWQAREACVKWVLAKD